MGKGSSASSTNADRWPKCLACRQPIYLNHQCGDHRSTQEARTDGHDANGSPVVPPGHFWRGEINRHYCRNCGGHYDLHTHTDEASTCPVQQETGAGNDA